MINSNFSFNDSIILFLTFEATVLFDCVNGDVGAAGVLAVGSGGAPK